MGSIVRGKWENERQHSLCDEKGGREVETTSLHRARTAKTFQDPPSISDHRLARHRRSRWQSGETS